MAMVHTGKVVYDYFCLCNFLVQHMTLIGFHLLLESDVLSYSYLVGSMQLKLSSVVIYLCFSVEFQPKSCYRSIRRYLYN